MSNNKHWQQHLREQLLQRSKDDSQIQRRWEKYVGKRRFWSSPTAITVTTNPQRLTK